jgi:hypothetical protein
MSIDSQGNLTWVTGAAPNGAAGGDLLGQYPNPILTSTGVIPGTYSKLRVDAKGRVLTGGTITLSDIPSLPASQITTGVIGVTNGGTGAASFTVNGVMLGNADGNLLSTAAGLPFQTLVVPSGGGMPSFGSINLSQQAAVTGILPTSRGGTGIATSAVFPDSGTILTATGTATLTNKSLTSPIISAATISGASLISGSTVIDTSDNITGATITANGNMIIGGNGTTANKLVLRDKGAVNAISLKAPDTLAQSPTWTLPGADGGNGQILTTDGQGQLVWATGAAPSGSAGGDLSGNYPTPVLTQTGIDAGTYKKIAVDAKGRAYFGTTLAVSDIPGLPASIINAVSLYVTRPFLFSINFH